MGFYRIIKNVARFILYQLPKKWLIIIIFALLMVFGLTRVEASSYDGPYYFECYISGSNNIQTATYRFCCDEPFILAPTDTGSLYWSTYSMANPSTRIYVRVFRNGTQFYNSMGWSFMGAAPKSGMSNMTGTNGVIAYDRDGVKVFDTSVVAPYITTSQTDIEGWNFTNLDINGGTLTNTTSYGSNLFSLIVNYEGLDKTIDIDNYKTVSNNNVTFSIPRSVLIDNPSIASGRFVSFTFLYYKSVEGGRDIIDYSLGSYTFNISSSNQDTINNDQTLDAISNVNNSINETNNFLQDTSVDTTDLTIDTPAIENSQVASQADTSLTNLFNAYLDAFTNSGSVFSVDLYIPNMSNGQILSTITIPSDYVSSKLSSISLFFLPGKTMLDLVHIVWYVLFGFWFIYMVTDLVTLLYSGLIMQKDGIEKLTDTYTGISKNLL